MTGRCEICGEAVPTVELLVHLRRLHPDRYEPLEVWPDGDPVVVDATLEPDDFTEEDQP